ncbi:MAG: hypothetical protein P8Y62_10735, partial [candidate division WOR-3 bacterium]
YDAGDIIGQTDFEYDENTLDDVGSAPMHGDAPYGKRGNLTKKTEWINEDDKKRSQQYWYDECGNLITMKDYMNYDYDLYYDIDYVFPDSIISPDGLTMDFNFDREGNLTSVTDKSGITDSFEYDIYGRTIKYRKGVSDNMVLLGEYEYHDSIRKAKEITYDSANSSDTTIYSYDGLGRLINSERCAADAVVMDYIYNFDGKLFKKTQPRFSDVSLYDADYIVKTFDGLGRITEIEYPKSASPDYPGPEVVSYEYNGNITDVFDESGEQTTLIKDASGNLDTVIDALGNETDYFYDVNGKLIEIKDAEGKSTNFYYDWSGNLVRREGPDRGIDTFAYDTNDNIKYHRNNGGDEITFTYDDLYRIESKSVNGELKETYYYDSYDNIGGETYDPP